MDIWVNEAGELIVDDAGAPIECADCPCESECGCTGALPEEYAVTIAGVSGCGPCSDVNGTYVLTRVPGCNWAYNGVINPGCGTAPVTIEMTVSILGNFITFFIGVVQSLGSGSFFLSAGASTGTTAIASCTTGLPTDEPLDVPLTAGVMGANGCWEASCGLLTTEPCVYSGATVTVVAV